MLLRIYPENPNPKQLATVVECLNDGGVIIYPTDTIYAIGCSLNKLKALERLAVIKDVKLDKANFSLICHNLSHISDYTTQISTPTFKLMKHNTPGPFTFILNANSQITKMFRRNKKTVGIRIPDHSIPLELARLLENPLVSTSIHDEDEVIEYTTDPELIYERYENQVDIVIDGGYGENIASTIIDCTTDDFEIIRQGRGIIK